MNVKHGSVGNWQTTLARAPTEGWSQGCCGFDSHLGYLRRRTTRPRGAAWSARLPVTQEIVGSSPIGGAWKNKRTWHGTQTGKRRSSNLRDRLWVRLPLVLLTTPCVGWALASPRGRNPHASGWTTRPGGTRFNSCPAHSRTTWPVLLAVQDAGPSSRRRGFESRTGYWS